MRLPPLGLLRDHDFRGLFASTTVSRFGQQVTQLALPLVAVLALDASEFQVGLLFALTTAAFLLVGLPAGAWVDRMRRRQVLIVGDLGRAALLGSIPLAWWTGALTIWQLYAVALLAGVLTVFFEVANQSYLPHLVGRANLVEANTKLEGVRAVSQVAGPGVAGQLIAILTAPVAILVDAVCLALSAIFVVRIRKREDRPEPRPGRTLARDIAEGLGFVLRHRLLRAIAACTATFNLFISAFAAMLIVFLARELGLGEATIGAVMMFAGAGGLLGFLVVGRIVKLVGQGPTMWIVPACTAPFAVLMPLAQPGFTVWVAAAGQLVLSAGVVVYNVTQVSFRQGLTPDHLLGRMNATMRFLVWGTAPLGGLLGGVLGQWVGVRETLWIGALGAALAFLAVFFSPLRTMRELPTDPAEPAVASTAKASETVAPAGSPPPAERSDP